MPHPEPATLRDLAKVVVAVVSSRQDTAEALNQMFRNAGIASHCHWAETFEALNRKLNAEPELIFVDTDTTRVSAADLRKLKDRTSARLPILFLRGSADHAVLAHAAKAGASDVLTLAHPERLLAVADRELRLYRMEHRLDATLDSATEYKKHMKALMADTPDALAYVQEGIIVDINPAWLELMGYDEESDLFGQPVMDCFKPESHGPLKGAIVATLKGKWNEDSLSTVALTRRGEELPLTVTFVATEYDGEPCVKMTCTKASEEPNARELKLREDALSKDPATLLYHRGRFIELARKRLDKKSSAGTRVLAWIRPDRFGTVCNDVGHIASETVFVEFADLVTGQLDSRDICGRFDGLSLMVLMDRKRLEDVETLGKRIVQQVSRHVFQINDQSTTLTCTIGLCGASDEAYGLDQLLLGARRAYEQGKKAGGNTTVVNETSSSDSRIQNYDAIWARHLTAALKQNRFRLLQQPVVCLDGSVENMFDLLVRMIDQQDRPVQPSEFIPAAERNNMMHAIDRWVVGAAIEFCRQRNPSIAFVKISHQTLQDASFKSWLQELARAAKLKPDCLCLEVSEENAARYLKE
ncbi:MAG: EAL domain-containing protein, partial [Pseudomonadota bacterium]